MFHVWCERVQRNANEKIKRLRIREVAHPTLILTLRLLGLKKCKLSKKKKKKFRRKRDGWSGRNPMFVVLREDVIAGVEAREQKCERR